MPLSVTGRGQSQGSSSPQMQTNHAFGLVILLALAILIVIRHLFGSIRVEVGAH